MVFCTSMSCCSLEPGSGLPPVSAHVVVIVALHISGTMLWLFGRDAVCLTEGCVQDKQRVTREAEEVAVVRSRQLVAFNLNQVI